MTKKTDGVSPFELSELLADIEMKVENCAAKLETIELPSIKGSYYLNMAHGDLKSAMIRINNLRSQLRG